MFSLKIVTSSMRGVSALASNQFGPSIPTTLTNTPYQSKISPDYCRPLQSRTITTSISLNKALTQREKRANVALHEAEIDLPMKPKKPQTPWIAFVQERKDEILSRKDKMNAAEMSVILAREWRQMDKTRYEEDYARRREEYLRQVESYENSLSEEHRLYIEEKKNETRNIKAMRQLRKTNIPTLPRNAANLFCHERCKHPDIKAEFERRKPYEVFQQLFEEYRNLSDQEKQQYLSMQEEDKSRFQHEFLAWYESVQNNDDLSSSAREQAKLMHGRYSSLGYV